MDDDEISDFVKFIFNHYRYNGFPYYNTTIKNQLIQLQKMDKYFKSKPVIIEDKIKQTMHCLATAWTYFPHAWDIKCNNMKTPMELFENDELFQKVIRKRLKRGTYISDSGIRKILKTYTGSQGVSNFRPSAARAIYDHFLTEPSVVWDMSSGFGGRLLGAISSPMVKKYIGTDPSADTYNGLIKMAENLKTEDMSIEINNLGSENYKPEPDSLDLCFTSPPYFNTEKYSNDSDQSYIKYPDKDSWMNGFLKTTVENCYRGLKEGGYLIINIANVKSYPDLEKDFMNMMENTSFKYMKTLKLSLSSINKTGFKYEPVFVFIK